ncbi:MAG: hypothetical protein ACT4PT_09615 [Methanobacteriota archaeon]
MVASAPFASVVHKGERLVLALAGGSSELLEKPEKPVITVHGGTITIPVAQGVAPFEGSR